MTHAELFSVLLPLGEIRHDEVWRDYGAEGLSASHAPQLLALIGDAALHGADVDSNEVWLPQHAWRALGQVGDAEQVAPLLQLLEGPLLGDMWAAQELPQVFGMIGAGAMDKMAAYLGDSAHGESARIVCAEGLRALVEHSAGCRNAVVKVLSDFIAAPDNSAVHLNGVVVGCLKELHAKEALEAVCGLYESGKVDISVAGTLAEVEAELTTPSKSKPVAKESVAAPDLDSEVNAALQRYSSGNSITNVSELDGFFAALGCAPYTIAPDLWQPAIWGGDPAEPNWQDQDEADAFTSAIMVLYKRLIKALNNDVFSAHFSERDSDGGSEVVADDWCRGFLRGINLWSLSGEPLDKQDSLFLKQQLDPVRLFATEAGQSRLRQMNPAGIAEQHKLIEANVRAMYQHWMPQRNVVRMPLVNQAPKVGRNAPCPCGSGKKYKRCCLH